MCKIFDHAYLLNYLLFDLRSQVYLTSYLIGEGLSGLLPSLFALIQGIKTVEVI